MQGILFTQPNFDLSKKGLKTNTRRIIKHIGNEMHYGKILFHWSLSDKPKKINNDIWEWQLQTDVDDYDTYSIKPRYKTGEKLYIKEPYRINGFNEENIQILTKYSNLENIIPLHIMKYDDNKLADWIVKRLKEQKKSSSTFCNKMFMPWWCANSFIQIEQVFCEYLQDISDDDCIKEGIIINKSLSGGLSYSYLGQPLNIPCFNTAKEAYASEINTINGKETWKKNPLVFSYHYKYLENE